MPLTSLEALPAELLSLISRTLDTPSLGSLRLSCKEIEAKLFDRFAKVRNTTRRERSFEDNYFTRGASVSREHYHGIR